MLKRNSTNGSPTRPTKKFKPSRAAKKKPKAAEALDLVKTDNQQTKAAANEQWSSDDEIPLRQLKNKRKIQRAAAKEEWTSDDETPLAQLKIKRRIKRAAAEEEWTSDDETPLAQLKIKRRIKRAAAKEEWTSDDEIPLAQLKLKRVAQRAGAAAEKEWSADDEIPLSQLKRRAQHEVPGGQTKKRRRSDERKIPDKRTAAPSSPAAENQIVKKRRGEKKRPNKRTAAVSSPETSKQTAKRPKNEKKLLPPTEIDDEFLENLNVIDWESDEDTPKPKKRPNNSDLPEAKRKKTAANPESMLEDDLNGKLRRNPPRSVRRKAQEESPAGGKKPRLDLKRKLARDENFESGGALREGNESASKIPKLGENKLNELEKKLHSIYYNPQHPAAFATAAKLGKAAGVSKEVAENWLIGQDAYTLHQVARTKFRRKRYVVHGMNVLWQADLCDMQNEAAENDNYRYILNCIDVFSKKLYSYALKDKTAQSIVEAFDKMFKEQKPQFLSTDLGAEFLNRRFQKFLKDNKVKFFKSTGDKKGAIVERVNRSLKNRMYKLFTSRGSRRYVDVLDKLADAYNNTVHSATGRTPNSITHANSREVWNYMYMGLGRYPSLKFTDTRKPRVAIADRVRIQKYRHQFFKPSASFSWNNEVFSVAKVVRSDPIAYHIKDDNDEIISGAFMREEIQRVNKPKDGTYMIDKILQTRGKGVSKQLLVSWLGYPAEFNSWIRQEDLRKL